MIAYDFYPEAFDIDDVFGLTRASINNKFKAPKILFICQMWSIFTIFILLSQLGVGEAFLPVPTNSAISLVELTWCVLASHF